MYSRVSAPSFSHKNVFFYLWDFSFKKVQIDRLLKLQSGGEILSIMRRTFQYFYACLFKQNALIGPSNHMVYLYITQPFLWKTSNMLLHIIS